VSLLRAIESACKSAPDVAVLVVANGLGVVNEILLDVSRLPRVSVLHREQGSLPMALLAGRAAVATPFFAFLDDDDELLPDSSTRRLAVLAARPEADLCICNGWRDVAGHREPIHPSLHGVADEPLRTVLTRNWLASCAAVFRSATVGVSYFEQPQPYAEWTWLAYRLSLAGKQVAVVDEPGYVIHDTPGSLSKTSAYEKAYLELYDRMLGASPPAWAREMILMKRSAGLHDLAGRALAAGQLREAWRHHMQSLRPWWHGRRYWLFSRKFLSAALAFKGWRV
jgi:hypothetical protein